MNVRLNHTLSKKKYLTRTVQITCLKLWSASNYHVLLKQLAILWILATSVFFTVTDRCFWTGFVTYFLLNNTSFGFKLKLPVFLNGL
jgi:hypothetical protein